MKRLKIIPDSENALLNININKATQAIPEWYKKSPQKIKGLENFSLIPTNPLTTTSTYKKCSPFLDALTNGYIFYLSQDIEVIRKEDGSPFILWRNPEIEPISWHDNFQWEGLHYPENCYDFVYKWKNSLILKTPRKYSTLFTHPHNRFDLPFYTLSGIVDTDKHVGPVQFPFFIKNNFTGIIEAGTPVAQITFFKRESWFRTISKNKQKNIKIGQFNFLAKIDRSYKNLFWQKKEYE
jgi:hypothetical protein